MAYNKVEADGKTLIDLTSDTVTAGTLLKDVTAHDRSGAQITGTVIVAPTDVTETEDNTAYLYKNSEHDAVYDELVGGSVAWNQLVQNGNFESTSGWGGVQATISAANNTLTLVAVGSQVYTGIQQAITQILANHVILASYDYDASSISNFWRSLLQLRTGLVYTEYGIKTESKGTNSFLFKHTSTPDVIRIIFNKNTKFTSTDKITVKNFYCVDLTQMFGSTIADYVYNLEQSTAGSGIAWLKSYGFFTKDYYAYNAGVLISTNTYGKKVVSETTEITYPIQSTDLRGLYKLNGNKLYTDGDIYSSDGTVTRKYGIVDLGTLNWYMTTNNRFLANVEQGSTGIITNALCTNYVVTNTAFSNLQDKEMNYGEAASRSGWRAVTVKDSAYTDAATFKTAMNGVYLIYELATPTIEPAQPFTSPQMVYRNGTEEYLDTRDVSLPVGGNRKYVDIPEWMVNEYFDDVRAEASNVSDIIEKLRRIAATNSSNGTKRTIYAPDDSNGMQITVRNNRTEVQVACGQASNANARFIVTQTGIQGGVGEANQHNPNYLFHDDCVGDSIGKQSSGSPLTGSEFDLNYETINLNGSTINIDDNMSIAFETVDDYTVNTINSPYMKINTDGISLLPKTTNQFDLLISRLPSGAGSELVVNSNGTVYQSSSSRDIKHDIQYIENTDTYHDALMQIKPATYVYNNDTSETAKLGMIAEDIADVMPIAALTGEGGKVENYDTRAIIAMLVMEVQRLNAEIERLRGDSDAN